MNNYRAENCRSQSCRKNPLSLSIQRKTIAKSLLNIFTEYCILKIFILYIQILWTVRYKKKNIDFCLRVLRSYLFVLIDLYAS